MLSSVPTYLPYFPFVFTQNIYKKHLDSKNIVD